MCGRVDSVRRISSARGRTVPCRQPAITLILAKDFAQSQLLLLGQVGRHELCASGAELASTLSWVTCEVIMNSADVPDVTLSRTSRMQPKTGRVDVELVLYAGAIPPMLHQMSRQRAVSSAIPWSFGSRCQTMYGIRAWATNLTRIRE
jgi:hypothetical protein